MRSREVITDLIESEWHEQYEGDIYQKLMMEVEKHPEKKIVLKKNDNGECIEFDDFHFHFNNGKLKSIE